MVNFFNSWCSKTDRIVSRILTVVKKNFTWLVVVFAALSFSHCSSICKSLDESLTEVKGIEVSMYVFDPNCLGSCKSLEGEQTARKIRDQAEVRVYDEIFTFGFFSPSLSEKWPPRRRARQTGGWSQQALTPATSVCWSSFSFSCAINSGLLRVVMNPSYYFQRCVEIVASLATNLYTPLIGLKRTFMLFRAVNFSITGKICSQYRAI